MRAGVRFAVLPVLVGLLACGWDPEAGGNFGVGGFQSDSGLAGSGAVPSFSPGGQGGTGWPRSDAATIDADDVEPVAPLRHFWRSLSAGVNYTCAINTTDHLYCWGANDTGQLGTGDIDARLTPSRVGSHYRWREVAVDRSTALSPHTCAIRVNGNLYCWGSNRVTQFAPTLEREILEPTLIGSDKDWRSVSTGRVHTCAIKNDGALYCWGENKSHQLGFLFKQDINKPRRVGMDSDWHSVSASSYHTCATKTDGTLYCWGAVPRTLPVSGHVQSPTRFGDEFDWRAVAAAQGHACALRNTGELLCWGNNEVGQLGDGSLDERDEPAVVDPDTDWQAVATAAGNSCGLTDDGQLSCWGDNDFGQLGDGSATARSVPTRVGSDSDWLSISVGAKHACGLRNSGRLFCWGSNGRGQLGDGTDIDRPVPTFVHR